MFPNRIARFIGRSTNCLQASTILTQARSRGLANVAWLQAANHTAYCVVHIKHSLHCTQRCVYNIYLIIIQEVQITFTIQVSDYNTLQSSQPVYLRSILHTHHSTRSLRLSNTNMLCAPFVRTSFGSRSFSVAAPKIWNTLPPALRMCTSHDTFRHRQYPTLAPSGG